MRLVTVSVEQMEDQKEVSAQLRLERVGERVAVLNSWVVVAPRTIRVVVCDGERLVVEEVPKTRLVYDKEQNMVSLKEDLDAV